MAYVVVAREQDIPSWLLLAAEVEPLFGPLVGEPSFLCALHKNVARGTAFCVRAAGGLPGTPLVGGLLFSPKAPIYSIGWLAVARDHRRCGVGRALVDHVAGLVEPPAQLVVVTFGPDHPAGEPARRFYERLGFHPADPAPPGPEGGSRQIFRRVFP